MKFNDFPTKKDAMAFALSVKSRGGKIVTAKLIKRTILPSFWQVWWVENPALQKEEDKTRLRAVEVLHRPIWKRGEPRVTGCYSVVRYKRTKENAMTKHLYIVGAYATSDVNDKDMLFSVDAIWATDAEEAKNIMKTRLVDELDAYFIDEDKVLLISREIDPETINNGS